MPFPSLFTLALAQELQDTDDNADQTVNTHQGTDDGEQNANDRNARQQTDDSTGNSAHHQEDHQLDDQRGDILLLHLEGSGPNLLNQIHIDIHTFHLLQFKLLYHK